jgi:hypothetical protein
MIKRIGWLLTLTGLFSACEPYDLRRFEFPKCQPPQAGIAYKQDLLDVEFKLDKPTGDIGSVGWDLGDGRTRVGNPVYHSYVKPGTYTVTIVIANSCNDVFRTTRTVKING